MTTIANKVGGRTLASISSNYTEATHFLLRVVAGLLFVQAGGMKLFGWFGGMPGGGTAPLFSQVGVGGLLEFFGGIAILLGFRTRFVAFILSGEMAVAYWQFHAPMGAWPIQNHGEPAVLLCFIFLYLSAKGAGAWSLDVLLQRLTVRRQVLRILEAGAQ